MTSVPLTETMTRGPPPWGTQEGADPSTGRALPNQMQNPRETEFEGGKGPLGNEEPEAREVK